MNVPREKRANYIIRNIPPDLWRHVKMTAAERGETVRTAMLRYLAQYAHWDSSTKSVSVQK